MATTRVSNTVAQPSTTNVLPKTNVLSKTNVLPKTSVNSSKTQG
jgi:hypothetical protein